MSNIKIKKTGTMLFVKCGVFAEAHNLAERTLRDLKSGKEISLSEVDANKYIAKGVAEIVEETENVDAQGYTYKDNNDTESPDSDTGE